MSDVVKKGDLSSSKALKSGPDKVTLGAFILFILISGFSVICVVITYRELATFWSAALRFTMAALLFWLLVLIRGVSLPRGRALVGALLFGLLSVGVAFIFVYYGLSKTPAGLFQTIVAIVPLLTILFAGMHKLEKITGRGIAGSLLAVIGIAIAVSGSLLSGVTISLPHIVAIVLGAACFAEAGIVFKLFPHSHPYTTNAIAMSLGAVMLTAASLINGETWVLPSSTSVWLALIFLIVTVVGNFLLYLFILDRWTATGTSYAFVLTPFVTISMAAVFFGDSITPIFLVGAAIVLIGVYIGALRPAKKTAVPVEEAATPPEDIHQRPGVPTCV